MTQPQIKVKIQRRPQIKLKVLPRFPSSVTGEGGIDVSLVGGNYIISPELGVLGDVTGPGPTASVAGQVAIFTAPNNIEGLGVGVAGTVITSDGAGVSWEAPAAGATPGGSTTQIQYNNAGALGGISGATTDGTTLTLVAPVLGAASATSINKVSFTEPAVGSTVTIADGKTVTVSNTLTFTGADGGTIPFGTRTRQVFTSGSGTYTTPANVKYINVRMIGGGGGGAGGGTTGGAGGTGGSSTFSTLTATGGTGGIGSGTSAGPGGLPTGGDINIQGGRGGNAQGGSNANGGDGGAGAFGGIGALGTVLAAAVTGTANTGGGGGGGGNSSGSTGGGGGGAGGYLEKIITSPASTYSYSVGAGGALGAAGTNGNAGAAGGSGIIIVEEFYQ